MNSALIVGATGLIGNELLHYMIKQDVYEQITILVRRPLQIKNKKVNEMVVDFDKLEQYNTSFAVDDVYCCLGTTIKKAKSKQQMEKIDVDYPVKVAELAKQQGATQFIVISAIGADPSSNVFYSRLKGTLEQKLASVQFNRLLIFRPSLLLGERKEFRFGEATAAFFAPVFSFFCMGKLRKYKPVEGRTVAVAMFQKAQKKEHGTFIYEWDEIVRHQ
ncbi:oxidoreductase [Alkalihalobacillus sp. LMS39]|uniref:oxidoreductase n=1 Tax=Alkalihalobacillus sp. LMS39 TaxID=2924032 RepID=UPI001FB295E9|nr:oxidoreductase [Alkalihalobacillus sp. LMS39]UOE92497.1 oxidoreductase [Alkalihalobacillus sp. LMS39]